MWGTPMSDENLRAELAEARRVARALYLQMTPEARRQALGERSEWAWLLGADEPAEQPRPTGRSFTIKVTPEQKAKALRDAARNSRVRFLGLTPGQRRARELLANQQRERAPRRSGEPA